MITPYVWKAAILISLAPALTALSPRLAQAEPRLTGQQQYEQTVGPFITTYCVTCHNPQKKKGKLSLDGISAKIVKETNGDLWGTILTKLESGDMPPDEADKQPDGKRRKAVMEWIATELGNAGIVRDPDLLKRPEYGNNVDHDKLFNGSVKTPSFSAPRVWRMRAELMRFGNAFPPTDFDYAALQTIDEPLTLRLRAMSETVADQMLPFMLGRKTLDRRGRGASDALRAYGLPKLADAAMYTGTAAVDRTKVEKDVDTLYKTFVSRAPTDNERKRYADFLEGMLKEEADREACLATAMRAMVMTPEAVYRMELGLGETLPDGRRMLSPEELAIAVPMSLGHSEAMSGLKTREDVEKAVRTLLTKDRRTNGPGATKHGLNPRFLEFMHQYFEYDQAIVVFKGDRRLKHSDAAKQLVEDTDRIVVQILLDDKDVLRRLLTTDQVVVSRRTGGQDLAHVLEYYKPTLAYERTAVDEKKKDRKAYVAAYGVFQDLSYMNFYNLEPDSALATSTDKHAIIKSPVPRAGILTQPSWLQAHSTFTDNHVVHRGKWVREKLLGGAIPEVPVGVDAFIPDDDDKSLRDRLTTTHQDFCWRCHHRMDPLGYPFEMYDDFGSYRAGGHERFINGQLDSKALDTSGEILESGVPGLDGPIVDAIDMINKIAATDRARQVFIRYVFRFFMGRNETLDDSQTLMRADKAYLASGGSFEELVVSILTSDSFLYRKEPGGPEKAKTPP